MSRSFSHRNVFSSYSTARSLKSSSLRSFYKKEIDRLPPSVKKQKQEQIVAFLRQLSFFKKIRFMAFYKAMKDEPDLSSFYKLCKGKACFPLLREDGLLDFYKSQGPWHSSPWAFIQPVSIKRNHIPIDQSSVFFIPGRVFDRRGGRLGRGRGCYDKSLAGLRKLQSKALFSSVLFVGIAFFEQVRNEPLNLCEHDILMDILVTDRFVLQPFRYRQKDRSSSMNRKHSTHDK